MARLGFMIVVCLAGAACRLNPECFGSNECASGFVCRSEVCVPAEPAPNADGGTPEAGCASQAGSPLPDQQNVFGDRYLFHLDDVNNTTADTSTTNRRPARCMGGTCPLVQCGAYGGAAVFDGVDDALTIEGADFDLPRDLTFTIEAWIKLAGTTTSAQCFFEAGEVALCVAPGDRLAFDGALSDRVISADTWHHVAAIRNADVPFVELFIDGQSAGVTNLDPLSDVFDADLALGRGFRGSLDEVRFAAKALFPEVDFSISQVVSGVAWNRGEDIWIAGERGQGARVFIRNATRPRWSPDGTKLAFLRCPTPNTAPCTLHLADRDGGAERMLAGDVVPVQGAFGRAGDTYYFVRGTGCPNEIVRVNFGDNAIDVIAAEADYRDVEIGALSDPGYEVLYVWRETCARDRVTLSAMPEPAPFGVLSEVYSSTIAGARYESPRALDCDGCPEDLLFIHDGRLERGNRGGGAPVIVREEATAVDFARRASWYYVVADFAAGPPFMPTLHLWDYNVNAFLPMTNNATIPERHVDFSYVAP
jgi:hypothetical protein